MIQLDKNDCLPEKPHDIVGKLQEIIVPNSELEEVCKTIIKNNFMDRVDEWAVTLKIF